MFRTEDNAIFITRGDSATIEITVTRSNSSVYTLAEGDTLTLSVKRSVRDNEVLISKKITSGNTITFNPSDTQGLDFGEYRYDVQLDTKEGKVYTVIEPDSFFVCEEVTV